MEVFELLKESAILEEDVERYTASLKTLEKQAALCEYFYEKYGVILDEGFAKRLGNAVKTGWNNVRSGLNNFTSGVRVKGVDEKGNVKYTLDSRPFMASKDRDEYLQHIKDLGLNQPALTPHDSHYSVNLGKKNGVRTIKAVVDADKEAKEEYDDAKEKVRGAKKEYRAAKKSERSLKKAQKNTATEQAMDIVGTGASRKEIKKTRNKIISGEITTLHNGLKKQVEDAKDRRAAQQDELSKAKDARSDAALKRSQTRLRRSQMNQELSDVHNEDGNRKRIKNDFQRTVDKVRNEVRSQQPR